MFSFCQNSFVSLPGYECELGDADLELRVQGEMFTVKLRLAASAKLAGVPKAHVIFFFQISNN